MNTLTQPHTNGTLSVDYGITPEMITETKARYAALQADTPDGYKAVGTALKEVAGTRIAVEKKRKQLKADSLEWGRKVDSEAARVTALILEIEEPLRAKKEAVDNERQRKLDAIKAEEDRRLAEAEQRRKDEEEAKIKAQREAEAAANKAEADRLAEERRKFALEQAEADAKRQAEYDRQQTELRKLEADRKALEAERRRLAKIEQDRQAAEARAVEAERNAALAIQREIEERERLDRLRPDAETLHLFAATLREIVPPAMKTDEGRAALALAMEQIGEVAECLSVWGSA